ncbi:MAG: 23S rRNA (adenine(2503)-C(2))-methyltransferase RlmN [Patescibacteria group bacterium]
MDLKKLDTILTDFPKFRLKQAYQALFEQFIENWEEVTVFPKDLRARLVEEISLEVPAKISKSIDGTIKALVSLHDGKLVETVLMRHADGRNSVCVSSQAGCPMGCTFCATGDMGFFRNLTAGEIVMQVLLFSRILKKEEQRVSNVIFMGMGEPLYNYDEVLKTVEILNKECGIAARHISLSTCGIVDGIKKLTKEPYQVNLAISLHAPNDEMRNKIMPVNKNYNVDTLLKTVADYLKETNRKVMIEYLLIGEINDSVETAQELASVLKKYLGSLFIVNVIPYNPTGRFTPPSRATVEKFKEVLESRGVVVTQRFTFGQEIDGACGQLAIKGVKGVSKGRSLQKGAKS